MNKGSEIDPDMDARAKECLRRYLAGDLDLSELICGRPSPVDEKQVRAKLRELLGEAESITLTTTDTNDLGITTYSYDVYFRNAGQLEYHCGINSDGTISRFSIMPRPGQAGPLKQYFEEGLAGR